MNNLETIKGLIEMTSLAMKAEENQQIVWHLNEALASLYGAKLVCREAIEYREAEEDTSFTWEDIFAEA